MPNPWEHWSDGQLVESGPGRADVEMMRRLKRSLEQSNVWMERLTWAIAICPALLLLAAGV